MVGLRVRGFGVYAYARARSKLFKVYPMLFLPRLPYHTPAASMLFLHFGGFVHPTDGPSVRPHPPHHPPLRALQAGRGESRGVDGKPRAGRAYQRPHVVPSISVSLGAPRGPVGQRRDVMRRLCWELLPMYGGADLIDIYTSL